MGASSADIAWKHQQLAPMGRSYEADRWPSANAR